MYVCAVGGGGRGSQKSITDGAGSAVAYSTVQAIEEQKQMASSREQYTCNTTASENTHDVDV